MKKKVNLFTAIVLLSGVLLLGCSKSEGSESFDQNLSGLIDSVRLMYSYTDSTDFNESPMGNYISIYLKYDDEKRIAELKIGNNQRNRKYRYNGSSRYPASIRDSGETAVPGQAFISRKFITYNASNQVIADTSRSYVSTPDGDMWNGGPPQINQYVHASGYYKMIRNYSTVVTDTFFYNSNADIYKKVTGTISHYPYSDFAEADSFHNEINPFFQSNSKELGYENSYFSYGLENMFLPVTYDFTCTRYLPKKITGYSKVYLTNTKPVIRFYYYKDATGRIDRVLVSTYFYRNDGSLDYKRYAKFRFTFYP